MKTASSVPTGIRFTAEDKRLLKALSRKLGVGTSAIVRLAIRKLAEIEHVGKAEPSATRGQYAALESMRGIARDLFRSVGGGEEFIKAERAAFAASALPLDGKERRKK